MTANAMSLKAKLRNIAKEKNINSQVLLQNYMFERLLERLSLSEYKDKFILKGGMLIASIVGIDIRSTMDLDATLRRLPLTEEDVRIAMNSICAYPIQDDVTLTVGEIITTRPDDIYGGFRAKITAVYDTITTPFLIDITTGDAITPKVVKHIMQGILDEKKHFEVLAYNLETILAEKTETILRRSTLNTRARDFYDVYLLYATQSYDTAVFREAVYATAEHRRTSEQIADIQSLLTIIKESADLQQMWEKYRRDFYYAANITYAQVMESLGNVCAVLI